MAVGLVCLTGRDAPGRRSKDVESCERDQYRVRSEGEEALVMSE